MSHPKIVSISANLLGVAHAGLKHKAEIVHVTYIVRKGQLSWFCPLCSAIPATPLCLACLAPVWLCRAVDYFKNTGWYSNSSKNNFHPSTLKALYIYFHIRNGYLPFSAMLMLSITSYSYLYSFNFLEALWTIWQQH